MGQSSLSWTKCKRQTAPLVRVQFPYRLLPALPRVLSLESRVSYATGMKNVRSHPVTRDDGGYKQIHKVLTPGAVPVTQRRPKTGRDRQTGNRPKTNDGTSSR